MPTLRPCVDFNAFIRNPKKKKEDPVNRAKQDAADAIWSWLETRANTEASRLCENSIADIIGFIRCTEDSRRIPVILTESSETLNPYSAFDKLSDSFCRIGVTPVRLNYMTSLESFQTSMIAAAVGVTGRGNTVTSACAQSTVSFKGLDLSILEDLGGIQKPLVVILEEADCLEPRTLLLDILRLVFALHDRYPGLIYVIIDTRLGIEEIVSDESIFLQLNTVSIPLLNSVELNRRIRTIFSRNILGSSDLELCGYPLIDFPHEEDLNFLSLELAQISSSPRDLCQQLVLIVANHFRTCPVGALLMGAFARPLDANSVDDIEGGICEIFSMFYDILKQPILDAGLDHLVSTSRSRRSPKDFKQLGERITVALTCKQRLATLGRALMNVFRALNSSNTNIPVPGIIQELMNFEGPLSDMDKFNASLTKTIDRLVLEVEGRIPKGKNNSVIAEKIINLNQMELIPLLVNDIGLDIDASTFIETVMYFSDLLTQMSVGEAVKEITQRVIGFVFVLNKRVGIEENMKVYSLLSPKKHVSNFSQKIIDPDLFGNTVGFLRRKKIPKSDILDPGLVAVNHLVQSVFDTSKNKKNKENIIDSKLNVTRTNFSVEYLIKTFGKNGDFEIGNALAVMDFIGIVKQPGFVDIASGTVSGTTSAVKIRKMYTDTWFVPLVAHDEEEENEADEN